ncbi:hypothetical protein GCM10022394_16670 [Zobellella aerophila]|uniref:TIGR02117 family protein n=2 Tax=Zobellella aerophila TaxID=870480 RepID=A0ABP6VRN5_9GAMM
MRLPALRERFGGTPYIEFGWGEKAFYQAQEITSGLTLRAAFWPTPSVVHAVAVPHDVDAYFSSSDIETLCLTDNELSSLIEFIAGSLEKNEYGKVLPLEKGIYGNSQFYQATGDYYLMNACNQWTAKGLKSIGMDIYPMFKLTAGSVINYLRNYRHATSQSCAGV